MNKQGILNAKIKFLIILAYTIILFLIVFLVFGKPKASQFDTYGEKSYDENVSLSMRIIEERKSLYETYSASNEKSKEKKLGLNEKSTYTLEVDAFKLNTSYITNMYVNVVVKTADNKYKYASSGSNSMTSGNFRTTFRLKNFSTKEVIEKEVGSGSKMKKFDETPKEVYIELKYKVSPNSSSKSEEKVLKYRFSTLDVSFKKFSKYQTRDILDANATENKDYINPSDDVLGIKIRKREAGLTSAISNVQYDEYKIQVVDIEKNVEKLMLNQDNVANGLVAIEQPTSNNPVVPEITNVKLEIWGKIESKDKKFSSYVKMYSLYGFVSRYREFAEISGTIDESFNLSEIYVVAEGSLYQGTTDSFKMAYQVNYHNLPIIPENEKLNA